MEGRAFNFGAGPAVLPEEVLKEACGNILNYQNTGLGIMEMSHRSGSFQSIMDQAQTDIVELLGLSDEYQVLFLQGGASLQFYMVPLNLLNSGDTADYINTGAWTQKAIKEAKWVAQVHIAGTSEKDSFARIPQAAELSFSGKAKYVYVTSNNTIFGTQWKAEPDTKGVPLVADASSDFLSRKIDIAKYGLIFAGAQKNIGPSGVAVVIVRKDMLDDARTDIPTMLDYRVHASKGSMFNTPPTFAIYIVSLVLQWIKGNGGLEGVQAINENKAKLLYDAIDESSFYQATVQDKDSRSLMNVTFRLPSEDLEKALIEEATKAGLLGLKGHRSVGGLRASIYNAFPPKGVTKLVEFMQQFEKKNG